MLGRTFFYKIIALYLLEKADMPLSNALLCEFFVSNRYTDYFTTRTTIDELEKAKMVDLSQTGNTTMYSISQLGRDTLDAMREHVNESNIADVLDFLNHHHIAIRSKKDIYADYDRSTFGGYIVHLRASDEGTPVIDLTLNVGNEEQARTLCVNWSQNYLKVYQTLLEILL